MKKYILSKREMTDLPSPVTNMEGIQYDSYTPGMEHPPEIQPPLPLDPPPAVVPFPMVMKQETMDIEYPNMEESNNEVYNTYQYNTGPKAKSQKSQIVCRDFVRGNCKRNNSCKFAHKYDLSQLEGIYTFCHRYQNAHCTFANCKFVHASVFEEQEFYRTGILPPQAKINQKRLPRYQHAPWQSPATASTSVNRSRMMPVSNPPPLTLNEYGEALAFPDPASVMAIPSSSSLKRPWTAMETFEGSSTDSYQYSTKRYKPCDMPTFRRSYHDDNMSAMFLNQMMNQTKICLLNEQNAKLDAIVNLLKSRTSMEVDERLRAVMKYNLLNSITRR